MGDKTWIKRPELPGRWERATGERHTFQLKRRKAYVLEVRDLHFHHDSAVLLPHYEPESPTDEKKPFGFDALRTCYLHAKEHPERKILLAGHADTTGADAYNVTLSEKRADAVLHALLGKRDDWVKIAMEKHKVEDYQLVLKWVDAIWKWGCDPGAVDNTKGPKTKKAVETFQKQYNVAFGEKIAEDGVVGKQTWEAVFEVYMEVLASSLETDRPGLAKPRADLRFFDSARQAVGCGENWLIEKPLLDEYKSKTNRRVEIVFIEPSNEPKLECHPSKGKCVWEKCELYDSKPFELVVIPTLVKDGGKETTLTLMVAAPSLSEPCLLVADGAGKVVRRFEEKDGERHEGTLVFKLDPATLPLPTQLVVEQWGFRYPHGVAFDPTRLREALAAGDNARASAIIYGESESLPAASPSPKLFAWDPPPPPAKGPAAATKHVLQVRVHVADDYRMEKGEIQLEKDGIDLDNRLVKLIEVKLDGLETLSKKDAVVGEFDLKLPGTTEYTLEIRIPDPDGHILDIKDKVTFALTEGNWIIASKLHPRLHAFTVKGKTPGEVVWRLLLDVSFLAVTERARRMNASYRKAIFAKIDENESSKVLSRVREDPRKPLVSPMSYLLVNPPGTLTSSPSVNVFLYFRNESNDYPDADRRGFGVEARMLRDPSPSYSPGEYGSKDDYQEYPKCNWAAQLGDSGADLLLVMPNVCATGEEVGYSPAGFGDLGNAGVGVRRLEKLVFMLWADRSDRPDKPPKLGTLIVGGWSSGMNIALRWFLNDQQNRVDAFFCFDGVGNVDAESKDDDKPKKVPTGPQWADWLLKKEGRKVGFMTGAYSELGSIQASETLAKKGLSNRILLHVPNDPSYWYTDPDYKAAHHDVTFPPLPKPGQPVKADTVYVAKERLPYRRPPYALWLRLGSDATTDQVIDYVSIHEAADYLYHKAKMPPAPDRMQFFAAFAMLRNTGDLAESDRAAKNRHTWSISGGSGVGGPYFQGYLEQVLRNAVEAGLLTKV